MRERKETTRGSAATQERSALAAPTDRRTDTPKHGNTTQGERQRKSERAIVGGARHVHLIPMSHTFGPFTHVEYAHVYLSGSLLAPSVLMR